MDGTTSHLHTRPKSMAFPNSESNRALREPIGPLGNPQIPSTFDRERESMRPPYKDQRASSSGRTASSRNNIATLQARSDRNSGPILPKPYSEEPASLGGFSLSKFLPWGSSQSLQIEAPKKAESPKSAPKTNQSSPTDIEGYFLQPAEDSRIQNEVTGFERSLETHVYNYYSNGACPCPNEIFAKVLDVGDESNRVPYGMLGLEWVRLGMIRRAIAHLIINEIAIDGDPNTTFLPKEIVALLNMASTQTSDRFRFEASSVLRRTAANLLRLQQRGESPAFTSFRRHQIRSASERLHAHFSPLANAETSEKPRMEQLEAIVAKAADLGVLLLLQPATYEFDWAPRLERSSTGSSLGDKGKTRTKQADGVIVFPALMRTIDNGGRRVRRQMVSRPVFADEEV